MAVIDVGKVEQEVTFRFDDDTKLTYKIDFSDSNVDKIAKELGGKMEKALKLDALAGNGGKEDSSIRRQASKDLAKVFKDTVVVFLGEDAYQEILSAIGGKASDCNQQMKNVFAGLLNVFWNTISDEKINDLNIRVKDAKDEADIL